MITAPGMSASVLPARASLDRRTPLPITTAPVAATAASTSTGQPAGSPIGVIPPYSIEVSATATSVAANDAFRTSRARLATPLTSALVVASTTHAANLISPSRLPAITTQLADSAGETAYRSQNAAVSARSGSISDTPTSSAGLGHHEGSVSAAVTGAASRPGWPAAGRNSSLPMVKVTSEFYGRQRPWRE